MISLQCSNILSDHYYSCFVAKLIVPPRWPYIHWQTSFHHKNIYEVVLHVLLLDPQTTGSLQSLQNMDSPQVSTTLFRTCSSYRELLEGKLMQYFCIPALTLENWKIRRSWENIRQGENKERWKNKWIKKDERNLHPSYCCLSWIGPHSPHSVRDQEKCGSSKTTD